MCKGWFCWTMILAVTLYIADAAYPEWDWSCSARDVGGITVSPGKINELADNLRAFAPELPSGCVATPHNFARRIFNSAFPLSHKS